MRFEELSVRGFCDAVASDAPTPGGGCVAALSGALAASLVVMVCGLTVEKEAYAAVRPEMEAALDTAGRLRERFLAAMDEDVAAFDAVMAAYKLPKITEAEKTARSEAIQAGLKRATQVPLAVAELSAEAAGLARLVREKGNRNATSDAGVAMEMAKAAFGGARLNVEINLDGIKDQTFVEGVRERLRLYWSQLESGA